MMKNLPLILTFFCTAFTWISGTQAMDDPWKTESHFKTKQFETFSSHDDLFDFDDYEATMESLNIADQQAEYDINALLDRSNRTTSPVPQPILETVIPTNYSEEDDPDLRKAIAMSLKIADLEQAQRDVDEAKEKDIQLHHQIGVLTENVEKFLPASIKKLTEKVKKLTEIEKETKANEDEAWKAYGPFLNDSDPQIEALEDNEEKERRRKAREEEKQKALETWISLYNPHAEAEAKLKEQKEKLKEQEEKLKEQEEELKKREEEQDAVSDQVGVFSDKLESLKKEMKGLEEGGEDK